MAKQPSPQEPDDEGSSSKPIRRPDVPAWDPVFGRGPADEDTDDALHQPSADDF